MSRALEPHRDAGGRRQRPGAPTARPAPVLAGASVTHATLATPEMLRALQRTVGNAATIAFLRRRRRAGAVEDEPASAQGDGPALTRAPDLPTMVPSPTRRRGPAPLQRQPGKAGFGNSPRVLPSPPGPQPAPSGAPTGERRVTELRIDGDGDQQSELLLRFSVGATRHHSSLVSLEVVQLSSQASQRVEFDLLTPAGQKEGDLLPLLAAATDGKAPTRISLLRSGWPDPRQADQMLLIYPPESAADGRDYQVQYQADAPGKRATIHLPVERDAPKPVATAGAVTSVDGQGLVDDFSIVDVALGAFGDRFRVVAAPTEPGKGRVYIAALADLIGESPDLGRGVEIALTAPLALRVLDGGPTSLSLDLNGDNKADLQIFDQLDIPEPVRGASPPATTRYHKLRVTGPAVGADAIMAFTVRAGMVHSATAQVAGITAVDVALGAYRRYGHQYRLTFRPTAANTAHLGVSLLREGQPDDSVGGEVTLSGPLSVQLLATGPGAIGVDLNGDNRPDLELAESVSAETVDMVGHKPFLAPRFHQLRVSGPALKTELSMLSTDVEERDTAASADALAVDSLAAQAKESTLQGQLDANELAMTTIRARAAKLGIIQPATLAAWASLSADLIKLEPYIFTWDAFKAAQAQGWEELKRQSQRHQVDAALREKSAADAAAFLTALDEETHLPAFAAVLDGLVGLTASLKAGEVRAAVRAYELMTSFFDQWIIRRLERTVAEMAEAGPEAGSGSDREEPGLAAQANFLTSQKAALKKVAEHKPQRLLAVFHPDQAFATEQGYMAELPLSLYYWKDEKPSSDYQAAKSETTWHLMDLTNPEKPHEYEASGPQAATAPPAALLNELDDPDRFPKGRILYQVPGGAAGQIATTEHLTFKAFLAKLGIGLMILGFVLMPEFGLLEFEVASTLALWGSAAAGALGAALDLAEHIKQGDLDVTTAVLDIGQIVSALAGVSAMRAGKIVGARQAAGAAAGAAETFYVVMHATRIAADVVTVAAFSAQAASQLDQIEAGPGTREEKNRAKLRLLAQLAVTGLLTAMQFKIPAVDAGQLGNGKTIRLLPGEEGVPIAHLDDAAPPPGATAHDSPDVPQKQPTGGHGAGGPHPPPGVQRPGGGSTVHPPGTVLATAPVTIGRAKHTLSMVMTAGGPRFFLCSWCTNVRTILEDLARHPKTPAAARTRLTEMRRQLTAMEAYAVDDVNTMRTLLGMLSEAEHIVPPRVLATAKVADQLVPPAPNPLPPSKVTAPNFTDLAADPRVARRAGELYPYYYDELWERRRATFRGRKARDVLEPVLEREARARALRQAQAEYHGRPQELGSGDPARTAVNPATDFPFGFYDRAGFDTFSRELYGSLPPAASDATLVMEGSGVSGRRFDRIVDMKNTGAPFDMGRVSDYDVAIVSDRMLTLARNERIPLAGNPPPRTIELTAAQLKTLGLTELYEAAIRAVTRATGIWHDVKFKIYGHTPVSAPQLPLPR